MSPTLKTICFCFLFQRGRKGEIETSIMRIIDHPSCMSPPEIKPATPACTLTGNQTTHLLSSTAVPFVLLLKAKFSCLNSALANIDAIQLHFKMHSVECNVMF